MVSRRHVRARNARALGGHLHCHNAHSPAPRLGAARGALGRSRAALGGSRRRGSRRREVALLRCAAPRPACRVLHEPRRAQNLQLGRAGGSLGDARVRRGPPCECHSWDTECYLTRYPDIYEGARALRLPRTVPRSHDGSRARRLLPQHRQRHVREVRVGANPRAHGGRGAGGGPRRVGVRHQVRRSRLARVAARPGAPPTPHAPRAQGSAMLRASVPRSARGLLRGRRRVVRLDPPR